MTVQFGVRHRRSSDTPRSCHVLHRSRRWNRRRGWCRTPLATTGQARFEFAPCRGALHPPGTAAARHVGRLSNICSYPPMAGFRSEYVRPVSDPNMYSRFPIRICTVRARSGAPSALSDSDAGAIEGAGDIGQHVIDVLESTTHPHSPRGDP